MTDLARPPVRLPFRPADDAVTILADLDPQDLDPSMRARLTALTHRIAWADAGKGTVRDVLPADPRPSRRHAKALADRLGPLAPVWDPHEGPATLVNSWEARLAEARAVLEDLAEAGADRRRETLDRDRLEKESFERGMHEWGRLYGSPRLNQILDHGLPGAGVYRDERLAREWPGFHVAAGNELEASRPAARPTDSQLAVVRAVKDHASDWIDSAAGRSDKTDDLVVSLVSVPREDGSCHAVRVDGWLGRYTILAWAPDGDDCPPSHPISSAYPDGMPLTTGSTLRPTLYGSAWGVRHVAAAEALKAAAVTLTDMADEQPAWYYNELLPPQLSLGEDEGEWTRGDRDLANALSDTLRIVGWKLAQPRHLGLACPAEVIVFLLIVREAVDSFDMFDQGLDEKGILRARQDLDELIEDHVLDLGEVGEILEYGAQYDIDEVAAEVVEPLWLSLWVPFGERTGDPAPRVTDGHERYWDEETGPEGATLHQTLERHAREIAVDAPDTWRVPTDGWKLVRSGEPGEASYLQTKTVDGVARLFPPPALLGERVAAAGWRVLVANDEAALEGDRDDLVRQHRVSWHDVLSALSAETHPLLVDLVVEELERTHEWQRSVAEHVLVAGPAKPLRQAADALAGMARVREDLEEARAAGLVRDVRMTRMGVRHPAFADPDAATFIARARFRLADDDTSDAARARFADELFEFVSLPVSPRMDTSDDGSVLIECGLAVDDADEAYQLAHLVISQVRWHVGVQPVDLEDDDEDEDDGAWFEIEAVNAEE